MKRKTVKRAYVGDFIKTTPRFSPKDNKGKEIDLKQERFRGIIVTRKSSFYGIRFGRGLSFTNHLNGLLSNSTGCMLEREEFELEDGV